MAEWKDLTKQELENLLNENRKKYDEFKTLGLKLDLSRGKPSPDILDVSNEFLKGPSTHFTADGTDIRNYGIATGIPELRGLFSELLDVPADQIIAGGNSSLTHMYNVFAFLYLFGCCNENPWRNEKKVTILCPCPGYDRHFGLTEDFGADMAVVPMTESGPDMDVVEKMVAEDASIKGIWCVPLYSNPQGVVYSDETVKRLASMKTAAPDFKIFWDNAYGVHHVYEEYKLANIMKLAEEGGNPERVFYFFSTSKVTFPGAGVGMVAAGPQTVAWMSAHIGKQTIGYDKVAQLKTVELFGNADGVRNHMRRLGKLIRPKFDIVLDTLNHEFGGTGLVSWLDPKGGYFVNIDTLDGCAKKTVALAKEAGAVLTGAGATYPYKKDPKDSNIRIAPTYPSLEELRQTMDLLSVCIKVVSLEKLLGIDK